MANNTTLEFDERADEWWSGLDRADRIELYCKENNIEME